MTQTVSPPDAPASAPRPSTPPPVPTSARVLGAIGRTLITAGIVVCLFVAFQLWGTNIQEARAQDSLRSDFDDTFSAAQDQLAAFSGGTTIDAGSTGDDPAALPAPITTPTVPGGLDPDVLALFFPEDGDAVARIEIPSIGVDKIIVNGVQVADLRKGPGHYSDTAAIGTEGNTAIAGHRTTYGAPFNRIDELQPGDEIHVTGVLGRFTYRVMAPDDAFAAELPTVDAQGDGHIIVRPSATWVLDDFADNRVTLTACHPKLSSRQRIIVAAELVAEPVAAPVFDPLDVAAYLDETDGERELPGETFDDDPSTVASDELDETTTVANLDEGLNGDRDAIPGAVAWMVGATVLWILAGAIGRRLFDDRLRRVAVRLVGLVPVAFCLWFSFEMIDRALPAG